MVAQGDGKSAPEADPKIPPNQKKKKWIKIVWLGKARGGVIVWFRVIETNLVPWL